MFDYKQTFSPAIKLIQNNTILSGSNSNHSDILVVTKFEDAINFATVQHSDQFMRWEDLRQGEASNIKIDSKQQGEIGDLWEEYIYDDLISSIPSYFLDAQGDIEGDLYLSCCNIFFKKDNYLFNQIYNAYSHGLWPCGWTTQDISTGKLIAFNSNH